MIDSLSQKYRVTNANLARPFCETSMPLQKVLQMRAVRIMFKLLRNYKFNNLNIILTVLIRKKFWKGNEVSQKGQARLALITLYF